MSDGVLQRNVSNHLDAIDLCRTNHLRMPALILIYSSIDIFAALDRPNDKLDVTRQDFLNWCENYLETSGFVQCQAIDLYSARCSVIHTSTSESALSRRGEARKVVYAWGNRKSKDLLDVIDRSGIKTHVVVHIDELAKSLRAAAADFLEKTAADPIRWALVLERSREFFDEHSEPI